MRFVIDMQGAQTGSRLRGIGRYTMSIAQAMARERGPHDIFLMLNASFPETLDPIQAAFQNLLPPANIRVWQAPGPVREWESQNQANRQIAERIREAAILSLLPDAVLLPSLFEGLTDDAVTSIGIFDTRTPTAVVLHDLIPLINPDQHYRSNQMYQDYYGGKLTALKHARKLLAVSESSRHEAYTALGLGEQEVTVISAACDTSFQMRPITAADRQALATRFGISRPFVLYTGGADERKNLPRLIHAYASLPPATRQSHQLVLAGKMPEDSVLQFRKDARKFGLARGELILTGYISDADLVTLYNTCRLFVFPSTHEGFGLPPLEAMACGAAVIASNATSLPEVMGRADAMFDPHSVDAIQSKMQAALSDEIYCASLIRNGLERAKMFSWNSTAKKALSALESIAVSPGQSDSSTIIHNLLEAIAALPASSDAQHCIAIAKCIDESIAG